MRDAATYAGHSDHHWNNKTDEHHQIGSVRTIDETQVDEQQLVHLNESKAGMVDLGNGGLPRQDRDRLPNFILCCFMR